MTATRPRALVVFPDQAQRDEVTAWLGATYDVLPSASFEDARRALDESPELLVTDVRLGAYNGLHLAIRGAFRDQNFRAIVVGDADPVLEMEAARTNAIYIRRPIVSAILADAVTKSTQKGRAGRRLPRKRVTPIDATAYGLAARLINVSYEGALVELPADAPPLPRTFGLRVPGVRPLLNARWIWMSSMPTAMAPVARYGVRLALSRGTTLTAWRRLVDSVDSAPGPVDR
jgi:hypothetical protein